MQLRWFSVLVLCLLSFIAQSVFAIEPYYNDHAVGWHWGDDPAPEAEHSEPTPMNEQTSPGPVDPVALMKAIRSKSEYALDKAILQPTVPNVKHYIELQNAVSGNSERFSNAWKVSLLKYPELNYSLKHPTTQMGRTIDLDQADKAKAGIIHRFFAEHHRGLFFFYRSTCPYCQRFAPILKAFVEQYHIPIVPITTDGIALPSFPNSKPDNGQAQRLHVTVEPTLMAVNSNTWHVVPISQGVMSFDGLERQIVAIATQYKGLLS